MERSEALGVPPATGVLGTAVFCAEVVKVAGEGVIFVGRETGTGVDVGPPCTLSPMKERVKTNTVNCTKTIYICTIAQLIYNVITDIPPPHCAGDIEV